MWERDHEDEITRNSGSRVVESVSGPQKVEDPYKEIQKKIVPNLDGLDKKSNSDKIATTKGMRKYPAGRQLGGAYSRREQGYLSQKCYRKRDNNKENLPRDTRREGIELKKGQGEAWDKFWNRDQDEEMVDPIEQKYAQEIQEYGDGDDGQLGEERDERSLKRAA
ncbi:hypothetical protein GYA13_03240 [Candidatus Kuenenbacteria bacterium]|nr:hypothetical protein [Candidatus Kuenenbacteria bacterium]